MTDKYRYEISAADLGSYRNTTLDDKFDLLDPDGFVTDEATGDRIISANGWKATKELVRSEE